MNRLAFLALVLPLAAAPAFSAAAVSSAHHGSAHQRQALRTGSRTRHAVKKLAAHINATMTSAQAAAQAPAPAATQAEPVALTGRLIYQEVELPAQAVPVGQRSELSPALPAMTKQMEQQGITTLHDNTDSTDHCSPRYNWLAFLKSISANLSLHGPGLTGRSWVTDVSEQHSLMLADEIAAYLAGQAPPQSTTLLLAPLSRVQADNLLTPALTDSLRKSGFGLVDTKRQAPDAQVVRYQVSKLNGGILIQLQFNRTEATRFYCLNTSDSLVADAPFCVREAR